MNKRNARQDLVNLFLGIWAIITPWLIGNHPAGGVVADYGIAGILIAFFACAALIAFRPWQEGVNIVLGAWLLVSPWVLGFRANASLMWSAVLIGVLVIICSALVLFRKQSQNL
jgi:SPW repeat